jgi:Tfp pilus assembly protein PilV
VKLAGQRRSADVAFTLLEVMIAVGLFFMAAFAILALVSQNLRAARSLQTSHVTAAMLAADLSLTNRLEEGMASGDFGELFPTYSWEREITEVHSNGLFNVDFAVIKDGKIDSTMTIYLFRPNSARGPGMRR